MTFAVPAHLLGSTAKFQTDVPLPLRVAGRSTQVEKRRIDVAAQVARVVLERLVALLELHAKAAVAGGQQQAGRRVHAHVSTHTRVPILAHGWACGTVAVLGRALAKEAVAGPGSLQ